MLATAKGAIWSCFERGLAKISTTGTPAIQVFGVADGLPHENMHAVCEDSQGRIWTGGEIPRVAVGTGNGKFATFPLKNVPEAASIRALFCDGDRIWVGGSFGLIRLNANAPDQQTWFTAKDGLADNWVYTIVPGAGGTLWIGNAQRVHSFPRRHVG
ncbi:MAG: two-component regulator propeller domain-containing protein [Acidobacteriota bacterium]